MYYEAKFKRLSFCYEIQYPVAYTTYIYKQRSLPKHFVTPTSCGVALFCVFSLCVCVCFFFYRTDQFERRITGKVYIQELILGEFSNRSFNL